MPSVGEEHGDCPEDLTRRERERLHSSSGRDGALHPGGQLVSALQRPRDEVGLRLAREVRPFFRDNSDLLCVWLCAECAREAMIVLTRQELEAA